MIVPPSLNIQERFSPSVTTTSEDKTMARKTQKTTAASTVRNIRRNSRKRYSGEEKIRIVVWSTPSPSAIHLSSKHKTGLGQIRFSILAQFTYRVCDIVKNPTMLILPSKWFILYSINTGQCSIQSHNRPQAFSSLVGRKYHEEIGSNPQSIPRYRRYLLNCRPCRNYHPYAW